MYTPIRYWLWITGLMITATAYGQINEFPYCQTFASPWQEGEQVEFLPGWWGNTVTTGNSRIHPYFSHGNHHLAMVPTSSFTPEVRVALDLAEEAAPLLTFWASSTANGNSGSTRPVFLEWSLATPGIEEQSSWQNLGPSTGFANTNNGPQAFIQLHLPDSLGHGPKRELVFRARRGEGSGSTARLIISQWCLVPKPLQATGALVTNDSTIAIAFSEPLNSMQPFGTGQVNLNGGQTFLSHLAPSLDTLFITAKLNAGPQHIKLSGLESQSRWRRLDTATLQATYTPLAINSVQRISQNQVLFRFNKAIAQPLPNNFEGEDTNGNTVSVNHWQHMEGTTWLATLNTPLPSHGQNRGLLKGIKSEPPGFILHDTVVYFGNQNHLYPLAYQVAHHGQEITLQFSSTPTAQASNPLRYWITGIGPPLTANLHAQSPRTVTLTLPSTLLPGTHALSLNGLQADTLPAQPDTLLVPIEYTPLAVLNAQVTHPTQIQLAFNKALAPEGLMPAHFQLFPGLTTPDSLNITGQQVTLYLKEPLWHGPHKLVIDSLTDEDGVLWPTPLTIHLFSIHSAPYQTLVINEIMADPNPKGLTPEPGLPNAEYIELYNTSNGTVWTGGIKLSSTPLPVLEIPPHGYTLLCAPQDSSSLAKFGSVISISPWNSLNNGGEALALYNHQGQVIDSLTYDPTWYVNEAKENGGWSLARGNPSLPCQHVGLWQASTHPQGGSPGQSNHGASISWPGQLPKLLGHEITDAQTLVLHFSQPMAPQGIFLLGSEAIAPEEISAEGPRIHLIFDTPLPRNTPQNLSLTGVVNCSGTLLADTAFQVEFDTQPPQWLGFQPRSPKHLQLYFNEPMGKALPQQFNLQPYLGKPNQVITEGRSLHLYWQDSMVLNEPYQLYAQPLTDQWGNAQEAPLFMPFTYQNHVDSIWHSNPHTLGIYLQQPLKEPLPAQSSVVHSLAGPADLLLPVHPHLLLALWQNAIPENKSAQLALLYLMGANDTLLATPNQILYYDTQAPKAIEALPTGPNQLKVRFNEALNPESARALEHYTLQDTLHPIQAQYQAQTQQVLLLFNTPWPQETELTLGIRGVKDWQGNAITRRQRISFTHDTSPPKLLKAQVAGPDSIVLHFNEALNSNWAHDKRHFMLTTSGNTIATCQLWAGSPKVVGLNTHLPLGEEDSVSLTLALPTDQAGNIGDTLRVTLGLGIPQVVQALPTGSNSLWLYFSEPLASPPAIMLEGFSASQVKPIAPLIWEASFVSPFPEGVWNGKASLVTDFAGNTAHNLTFHSTYQNPTEMAYITGPHTLAVKYQHAIAPSQVSSVTKAIRSSHSNSPADAAYLMPSDASTLQLVFTDSFPQNSPFHITIPRLKDTWGQPIPAVNLTVIPDKAPPRITRAQLLKPDGLFLQFNEALNPESTNVPGYYTLHPNDEIATTTTLRSDSSLWLEWPLNEWLGQGPYAFTIQGLTDLAGNRMVPTELLLTCCGNPSWQQGDILLTELMPDPTPSKGLPPYEFVELTNPGTSPKSVLGLALADASTSSPLPAFTLAPGQSVLLCPPEAVPFFEPYGPCLSLSPWPSLNNGEDWVQLYDVATNTVLDAVAYTSTWYQDVESNGHSLERYWPASPCHYPPFGPSPANTGGRPGSTSTFSPPYQPSPLALLSTHLLAADKLLLQFNQPAPNYASFEWEALSGPTPRSGQLHPQDLTQLIIQLSEPLATGQALHWVGRNGTDCSGEPLVPLVVQSGLGAPAQADDIIITELMPAPATDETEWIELYNASAGWRSLKGLKLHDAQSAASLPPISIAPKSYLVLCKGTPLPIDGALPFSALPTLNNTGDSLWLTDSIGNTWDAVAYGSTPWPQGYATSQSLERIALHHPCSGPGNWQGSKAAKGHSAGITNSVNAQWHDARPPELLEAYVQDSLQVVLQFNEALAGVPHITISPNRSINRHKLAGWGAQVTLYLNTPLDTDTAYTLQLNNVADCFGNAAPGSSHLIRRGHAPQPGTLIFNELFFDPYPGGTDFIELYNNSPNYLRLDGLELGKPSLQNDDTIKVALPAGSLPPLLAPYSYRLLTTDKEAQRWQHPQTEPSALWEVPALPSLPNAGDTLLLFFRGTLLETMGYHPSQHHHLLTDTEGKSLERVNPNAPANQLGNWQTADEASGFASPGFKNSSHISHPTTSHTFLAHPKVIGRSQAHSNFTQLSCTLPSEGFVGSVYIYSSKGVLVKTITQQQLLGQEAHWVWHGDADNGTEVRTDYYLVVLEAFHPDGRQITRRCKVGVGQP